MLNTLESCSACQTCGREYLGGECVGEQVLCQGTHAGGVVHQSQQEPVKQGAPPLHIVLQQPTGARVAQTVFLVLSSHKVMLHECCKVNCSMLDCEAMSWKIMLRHAGMMCTAAAFMQSGILPGFPVY